MELNVRLDEDGRTTFDPERFGIVKESEKKEDDEDVSERTPLLSYATRSVMLETLVEGDAKPFLDEILMDCEVADCAILPRTFWADPKTEPRCALEQLALDIFHLHVGDHVVHDKDKSGVEWWVQIRPPPPGGRYTQLAKEEERAKENGKDDQCKPHDAEATDVSFHWDKDEELRLVSQDVLYIHPHISTVTYLTQPSEPSRCLPTVVLPCRKDSSSGSKAEFKTDSNQNGYVCWPKQGKHLVFDGRYLHAAPQELVEGITKRKEDDKQEEKDNSSEDKKEDKDDSSDDKKEEKDDQLTEKQKERRQRRITFLANVWLNYQPLGVEPFPDSMLDKMSDIKTQSPLINDNDSTSAVVEEEKEVRPFFTGYIVPTPDDDCKVTNDDNSDGQNQTYKWTLGSEKDGDEAIEVALPMAKLQKLQTKGGNAAVEWPTSSAKDGITYYPPSEAPKHPDVDITYQKDEANIRKERTTKQDEDPPSATEKETDESREKNKRLRQGCEHGKQVAEEGTASGDVENISAKSNDADYALAGMGEHGNKGDSPSKKHKTSS